MRRILLSFVLCLCLPLSLLAQQKNLMSPEGFMFDVDAAGKAHITGHSKSQSELTGTLVVLEAVVNTVTGISYPVISIKGFNGYTLLTGLSLPNSVTTIGNNAFTHCSGLTGLSLPNSVTTIGNNAFTHCSGLTGDLVLPNSVTTIGNYAFAYCSGLTGLSLSNSVTTIGNYAFAYCSGLTGLSLPNSVTTIGDYAFSSCSGLTGDLVLPNSVTTIGSGVFFRCSGITGFTVEAGSALTSLGSHTWYDCTNLEYIDLTHIPATALTSGYGGGAGAYFRRSGSIGQPFTALPKHTVVYLPTGVDGSRITQSDSTANYVLDGQCQWLSVQDRYDYELPRPFTALKATYNNTSTSNYRTFSGTTCKTVYLPYPATVPTGMRAYRLARRHRHVGDKYEYYFVFSALPAGEKMAANTPYLLLVTDGGTHRFGEETDVYVPATPAVDASAQGDLDGEWLFCGTTEKISNADAAAQGAYNLKNNVWHPISTSQPSGHVAPFRCFIKPASSGGGSPTKSFAIFLAEEEDTETGLAETHAALRHGLARIYNVQGQYLGTDFEALPQGLYIVDGKKVYKP